MSRITTKISRDNYAVGRFQCFEDTDGNCCGPAIDKLAQYENLEESHQIIVPPNNINIGDNIFIIHQLCWNCPFGPNDTCEQTCNRPKDAYGKISKETIFDLRYSMKMGWIICYDEKLTNRYVLMDGLDKHWFLSEDEAKKHLDIQEYL